MGGLPLTTVTTSRSDTSTEDHVKPLNISLSTFRLIVLQIIETHTAFPNTKFIIKKLAPVLGTCYRSVGLSLCLLYTIITFYIEIYFDCRFFKTNESNARVIFPFNGVEKYNIISYFVS